GQSDRRYRGERRQRRSGCAGRAGRAQRPEIIISSCSPARRHHPGWRGGAYRLVLDRDFLRRASAEGLDIAPARVLRRVLGAGRDRSDALIPVAQRTEISTAPAPGSGKHQVLSTEAEPGPKVAT